ncbi:MAG: heavy-metal-associated domain-containing protein [Microbacteriaceae bacterium]|nr:heavy-metal-associated domain-containing protein [Microbacteriaceae bacterium]
MTTTEYQVTGMTCGHCVASVKDEFSALEGVESVEVDLNKGGVSTVTVVSAEILPADAATAAVSEAGYELVGPRTFS